MPVSIKEITLTAPDQIAPVIWRIRSYEPGMVVMDPYWVLEGNAGFSEGGRLGSGQDGWVQLKVHPELFYGAEKYIQQGMLAIGLLRMPEPSATRFWEPAPDKMMVPSPGGPGVYSPRRWRRVQDYADPEAYEHFLLVDTGNVDTLAPGNKLNPRTVRVSPRTDSRGRFVHDVWFRYFNEYRVEWGRGERGHPRWVWYDLNTRPVTPPRSVSVNPKALRFDPLLDTFRMDAMDEWFQHLLPVGLPLADPDELGPGFMQIGYTLFEIDPTAIAFNVQYPLDNVPLLRAAGTHKMVKPHSVGTWRLQVTLEGEEINSVLVPLLRQIDRCPFLPVINRAFWDMGIDAICVEQVQVETMTGTPNAVTLTLGGHQFQYANSNVYPYAPMLLAFNWPLFKLYTDYLPRYHYLDNLPMQGVVRFLLPTERYLRERLEQLAQTMVVSEQLMLRLTAPPPSALRFQLEEVLDATRRGEALLVPLEGGRKYYAWATTDPAAFRDSLMAALPAPSDQERIRGFGHAYVREVRPDGISEQPLTVEQVYDLYERFEHAMRKDRTWAEQIMRSVVFVVPASDDSVDPTIAIRHQLELQAKLGILSRAKVEEQLPKMEATPDYQEVAIEGVVWERILFQFVNQISAIERDSGGLIHQFLGRGDTAMLLEGVATPDGVRQLRLLVESFRALAFAFRGVGLLRDFYVRIQVENELATVMGVRDVLPVSLDVENLPHLPDSYRVSLMLVSFDPGQMSREQVKRLSPRGAQLFTRERVPSSTQWDGEWEYGPASLLAYSNVLQGQLAQVEVYPDLRLPRYDVVNRWLRILSSGVFASAPELLDDVELFVRRSILELYPDDLIPELVHAFRQMVSNGLGLPDLPQYVDPDFFFSVGGEAGRAALSKVVQRYAYGSVDLGIAPEIPLQVEFLDSSGLTYVMDNARLSVTGAVPAEGDEQHG